MIARSLHSELAQALLVFPMRSLISTRRGISNLAPPRFGHVRLPKVECIVARGTMDDQMRASLRDSPAVARA